MINLPNALKAWQSVDFNTVLKKEIEQLDVSSLPLQQGLSHSSYTSDEKFSVMIISVTDEASLIRVKVGVFYSGVIAGCNCADDPSSIAEQPEYCELEFAIDKHSAETTVACCLNKSGCESSAGD